MDRLVVLIVFGSTPQVKIHVAYNSVVNKAMNKYWFNA